MQQNCLVCIILICLICYISVFLLDDDYGKGGNGLQELSSLRKLSKQEDYFDNMKNTTIDDIHVTLKTTGRNHVRRIALLTKTWIKTTNIMVNIITDVKDKLLRNTSGIVLWVSRCKKTYRQVDLCCKTGKEFKTFMKSKKAWWCHFDDDIYVNTKGLLKLLRSYSIKKGHYIGRRSVTRGLKVQNENITSLVYFATGAGYCVTRTLAQCMKFHLSGKAMVVTCERHGFSDDVAIAYAAAVCSVNLTESTLFHSHFEQLAISMNGSVLEDQVSFTYMQDNVTPFRPPYQPAFNNSEDPTRFLSIHCLFYPQDEVCPKSHIV